MDYDRLAIIVFIGLVLAMKGLSIEDPILYFGPLFFGILVGISMLESLYTSIQTWWRS